MRWWTVRGRNALTPCLVAMTSISLLGSSAVSERLPLATFITGASRRSPPEFSLASSFPSQNSRMFPGLFAYIFPFRFLTKSPGATAWRFAAGRECDADVYKALPGERRVENGRAAWLRGSALSPMDFSNEVPSSEWNIQRGRKGIK